MLKKAKADARSASPSNDMSQTVKESSRQIWLAGLGAFSRAQAEGAKVFEALVKQGESLESRTRNAASTTAAAARGAAADSAARMQTIAGDTWDKLEKVFEDRVAKALARLGVHTQSDVEMLTGRVDALAKAVNELIRASGRTAKPSRKGPRAKSVSKGATRGNKRAAKPAGDATASNTRTASKGARASRKVAKAAE
jgi:poly(hydroxyalkanoate) granule-associated protein